MIIMKEFSSFLQNNAGRLLILAVFVTLLLFAHHSAGVANEADFASFCQAKAGEAFAAFLGLITGAMLSGKNGSPPPPDVKP